MTCDFPVAKGHNIMWETFQRTSSAWLSHSNPWWIAIAVGYVVLCLAVLVLARMHWVQARRFSACVILSVLAHALLLGALGLLRLFDQPGKPDASDGIEISLSPDAFFVEEDQTIVDSPVQTDEAALPVAIDEPHTEVPLEVADVENLEPEQQADEAVDNAVQAPTDAFVVETSETFNAEAFDTEAADEAEVAEDKVNDPVDEAPAFAANDSQFEPSAEMERTEPSDSIPPSPPSLPIDTEQESVASEPAPSADFEFSEAAPAQPIDPTSTPTPEQESAPLFASEEPAENEPATESPRIADVRPTPDVSGQSTAPDTLSTSSDADVPDPWRPVEAADVAPTDAYALREAGARSQIAQRRGATPESEAAVRAALQWLAENQSADGRWDVSRFGAGHGGVVEGQFRGGAGAEADTGISGLAILAFLSAGNTHAAGEHRVVVQRGLEFLMRSQQSDGNLAGNALHYARMYCHGMATLALCEAYGMTRDQRLQPFAADAIHFICRTQNTYTGSWRYVPGEPGDMSQFGWQVMALLAGQRAGLAIPPQQLALSERFLQSVSRGTHGGLACYRPGEQVKVSMTAEALALRAMLHGRRHPEALSEAAQAIIRQKPDQGPVNLYAWYYATLGLCQVGGPEWDQWNRALQDRLLPLQRTEGPLQGSWDTDTVWGTHGGRVYTTAMATLCLEVYYRYAPLP
jgi:hypothetical protein